MCFTSNWKTRRGFSEPQYLSAFNLFKWSVKTKRRTVSMTYKIFNMLRLRFCIQLNTVQKNIHHVKIEILHLIEYIWIQFKQPPQSTANKVNILLQIKSTKRSACPPQTTKQSCDPHFSKLRWRFCNAFLPQWLQNTWGKVTPIPVFPENSYTSFETFSQQNQWLRKVSHVLVLIVHGRKSRVALSTQ